MRVFVGIDLSDGLRNSVTEYIRTLRENFRDVRVSWERPEKLHLTLKFLGDVDKQGLSRLKDAIARAAAGMKPFKIEINGTGVFPQVEKPRILWLGIADNAKQLNELYERLEAECDRAGFLREKRKFKPHLTLGRIKEPVRARDLATAHERANYEPAGMEVSELVIFLSTLQPTGSIYQRIHRVKLGSTS